MKDLSVLRRLAPLALLLVLAALCGCAGKAPFESTSLLGPDAELMHYQEGVKLFAAGEYEQARERFEPLAFMSSNADLRRRALYALACTKLISATTMVEFDEAVDLWYAWSSSVTYGYGYPDPKLMAPLMEFLRPPFAEECGEPENGQEAVPDAGTPSAKAKPQPDKAAPRPKPEKLDKKDKDPECRKLLQASDRKVKRLQEQLNALEAIHQEIRERKKEMQAPR